MIKYIKGFITRATILLCIAAPLLATSSSGMPEPKIATPTPSKISHAPPLPPRSRGLSLTEMVSRRVKIIFDLNRTGNVPLHIGRKSVLRQMQKDPQQLMKDLPRVPVITIGRRVIKPSKLTHRSIEQKFLIVAHALEKFVGTYAGNIENRGVRGRLGQFWTTEVIYGLVQTFSAPAVQMAYDNPMLASGEWMAPAGTALQSASFMLEAPTLLVLSYKTEKNMQNLVDENKENVNVVTKYKLYFDLITGEVTFNHIYNIDGVGTVKVRQLFD